jgi:hypothetical protein
MDVSMRLKYHLTPENQLAVLVIVYTHTKGVLSNAVKTFRKLKVENTTEHTYG